MPRPARLCVCGNIVPGDQVCPCQIEKARIRKARHDRKRPSSRQRGYTREWEKARADYLRHHPVCKMCGDTATLVDHIKPHRGDMALFWNHNNWQALCAPCHNSAKQRQERADVSQ